MPARRARPSRPGGAFAFDVLAPRLDFLAEALHPFPPMRVDADIAGRAPGVERFVRSCVDRYDAATQTLSSTFFYDIHRSGGASERQVRDLDWHMYFPAELEGLLDAAGLEPLERRGGWNGEPLDAGARRYVFVCGAGLRRARPRAAAARRPRSRAARPSGRGPTRAGWPRGP